MVIAVDGQLRVLLVGFDFLENRLPHVDPNRGELIRCKLQLPYCLIALPHGSPPMTAVIMSGRLQLVASLAKFVHCGPNVGVPLLGCSTLRQLYDTDGLPTVILQNPEWSTVGKIHFSPPPTGGSPLRQFKRTAVTLPARGKSRAG